MPNRWALLIWLVALGTCGLFFLLQGYRWGHSDEPAGLWKKGQTPRKSDFTDLKAYNKAMGRMLKLYSIVFFVTGALFFWQPIVAGVFAFVGTLGGLVGLVFAYSKIFHKYKK